MQKTVKLVDLINKADEIKESKKEYKLVFVNSLNGNIKIKKPSRDICMQAYEMENCDEYLIYESVVEPNLKDKKLHEAYKISNPLDIVSEIFEAGEISNLGVTILKTAGYDEMSVKLVDDIKN